jgi:hypothetical protein
MRHGIRELNWARKLCISPVDPTEFARSGSSFVRGLLPSSEYEIWWSGMIEVLVIADV